jgi:hypothetical protein
VVAAGGAVVVSAYAADDTHPAKGAVEAALAGVGWQPPAWYEEVRSGAVPRLATVEACEAAVAGAGGAFAAAAVRSCRVRFDDLDAAALVAWRLGMAHHAPFLATLLPAQRAAVAAEAVARLGTGWAPLERSILVITAVR